MTMIRCEDCGKEISDKSTECVYCGCPTKYSNKPENVIDKQDEKMNSFIYVLFGIFGIIIVILIFLVIIYIG